RAFLCAKVVRVATAIGAVGRRHQNELLLRQEPEHQHHSIMVNCGGAHRVEITQRRADECGEGNYDVGFAKQGRNNALHPNVATYDGEAWFKTDMVEACLSKHEIVEH